MELAHLHTLDANISAVRTANPAEVLENWDGLFLVMN